MPLCYTLTRKSNLDAGPVSRAKIDDEMCAFFNVQPHPDNWHHHWDSIIGLYLASGKSFNWMREMILKSGPPDEFDQHMLEIINWLDTHFIPDAWYQVGR